MVSSEWEHVNEKCTPVLHIANKISYAYIYCFEARALMEHGIMGCDGRVAGVDTPLIDCYDY